MERGQEGRPAHGTDGTVEGIDLVGAQAEGDAHDEPIEHGASTEGPSAQHVRGGGPPAHWLAYIRARAPWLLSAGGLLGETTESRSPDVVPHGPASHIAPWLPVEPASSAVEAATSASPTTPAFNDAPTGPADERDPALRSDAPGEDRRRGDGEASLAGMPEIAAESRASGDRPPAGDDPGGRRKAVDAALRDAEQEGAATTRLLVPAAPDAGREAPTHARPPAAWADQTSDGAVQAATAAPLAPIPSPEPMNPSSAPIAWPAFPRSDIGRTRPHPGEPWPPQVGRAPRTASPMSAPDSPVTERASASFVALPAPTGPAKTPRDLGGWRVRAAAPDTSVVARLALPPWPDLPEPPPDDDDPDWRAIERRLQRAARLDREQRRR